MLAIYTIASAAALIATGRWVRSIRSGGFEADDPKAADSAFESLRGELRATEEELEAWKRLFWRRIDG
ncbi:MAG: hypothetical protein ACRDJ1_05185 [Actinomycetota bacterium]